MLISDVATTLEVSTSQVHYYIREGHLKSRIIDNIHHINTNDFNIFFKNYFTKRHIKKGKKIASQDELETLVEYVSDFKSDMEQSIFLKKYNNPTKIIPPIEQLTLLRRNLMIIKDNKHMKQKDIAIKYDLSLRTIEEIIKKSKQRSN